MKQRLTKKEYEKQYKKLHDERNYWADVLVDAEFGSKKEDDAYNHLNEAIAAFREFKANTEIVED